MQRKPVGRIALALLWLAAHLPAAYVTWLLYRWSLLTARYVTESQRRDAVTYWDQQGALWCFCRWPKVTNPDANKE
jgi:hypothetical protein